MATEPQPSSAQAQPVLLSVRDLRVHFATPGGLVRAVDGMDLDVHPGETVALVGESGCGKSTFARAVVGIQPPTSGQLRLGESDILQELSGNSKRRRALRRRMQMIFQDPDASLNPRMTLAAAIGEPLQIHSQATRSQQEQRVIELLNQVGLAPSMRSRYPHELSGGQRQRVCIARALAVAPELLICDEATSALDVSVQAQILNLLAELKRELSLSYLFITHDLGVVRQLADRVVVMYLGKLMEAGPTEEVLTKPAHPYTRALMAAVPRVSSEPSQRRLHLSGDIPSPANPPSGCRFHTRCAFAEERCGKTEPPLEQSGKRQVRCLLSEQLPPST